MHVHPNSALSVLLLNSVQSTNSKHKTCSTVLIFNFDDKTIVNFNLTLLDIGSFAVNASKNSKLDILKVVP